MVLFLLFPVLKQELVLHEAARKNNIDKVKELIQKKVDVNAKNNVSTLPLVTSQTTLYSPGFHYSSLLLCVYIALNRPLEDSRCSLTIIHHHYTAQCHM